MTEISQTYRIMPRPHLKDGDLALRAVGPDDIEAIRQWRNTQMAILRQTTAISEEAQQRYFAEHIWPDKGSLHPRQILLAIEQRNKLVGYGGLVHIAWHDLRAEVSFLLEPSIEQSPVARGVLFSRYLRLVQELAFSHLNLLRLWTETYAHRSAHVRTLEGEGFRLEGRLRNHVIIEGKPTDSLLHGLLANEWKDRQ